MKVSIVLPIRKAEKTLRRAIDSVLQQTFEDFELICVLNDSSDDDEKIVNSYLSDKRVVSERSIPGLVPALNKGIQVSKSELVARQDADDFWYPEKLEKQISFLEKNPEIDILGVQIRSVNEEFFPITFQEPKRPTSDQEIKGALLSGWNCIPHPGVIFRKKIMEKLGGYDDTFLFAEDYSLWLRSIQWYKFGMLEEVLLDYTSKHNPKYDHRIPQFLCSVYRAFYGVE